MPSTARYIGSSPGRQFLGLPGHCSRCAEVGHIATHPYLGCADVGCSSSHDGNDPLCGRCGWERSHIVHHALYLYNSHGYEPASPPEAPTRPSEAADTPGGVDGAGGVIGLGKATVYFDGYDIDLFGDTRKVISSCTICGAAVIRDAGASAFDRHAEWHESMRASESNEPSAVESSDQVEVMRGLLREVLVSPTTHTGVRSKLDDTRLAKRLDVDLIVRIARVVGS